MIPASLLLILVAVGLLVLGLTSGSSGMLIGSIVSSLLAAVALVVGARQNAMARRPQRQPVPLDDLGQFDGGARFVAQPQHAGEQQFETEQQFSSEHEFSGPQFAGASHPVDDFPTAEHDFR